MSFQPISIATRQIFLEDLRGRLWASFSFARHVGLDIVSVVSKSILVEMMGLIKILSSENPLRKGRNLKLKLKPKSLILLSSSSKEFD